MWNESQSLIARCDVIIKCLRKLSRHLDTHTHVSNIMNYHDYLLPSEMMKFRCEHSYPTMATTHNIRLLFWSEFGCRLLERNTLPWCRFWDIVRVRPTTKQIYPFTIRVGNIDIKWMPKSILAEVVANCDCNDFIIKPQKSTNQKKKKIENWTNCSNERTALFLDWTNASGFCAYMSCLQHHSSNGSHSWCGCEIADGH